MLTAMILLTLGQPAISSSAELAAQVDPKRIRASIEHLAAFNTRNTNTPELFQAAGWIAAQYSAIPGMKVELMKYEIEPSRRVPAKKEVVQVVATLPGADDRRIIMGGHFDSINMTEDADVFKSPAPGANDDLSGAMATLEVARVLAQAKWKHTLVFVAFSGEEQGLLGSRALAKRATDELWKIDAVLSNDMIGNSSNNAGQRDSKQVRVFSEDRDPNSEHPHNSRELARFIQWTTQQHLKNFGVKLVFRKDRFGRGGDHSPFNEQGFNAVRLTEVFEEYTRQHTPADLPKDIDFAYLANGARVNLIAIAALANAAEPPGNVRVKMDQSHDTTLTWSGSAGTPYVVYWRNTTSPIWEEFKVVGQVDTALVQKVNKDDHIFAVGAEGGIPVVAR